MKKLIILFTLFTISPLFGNEKPSITAAPIQGVDIAWVMICTGLVMLMQAGFALLESGLTRTKNSVNVLMKNYTDMTFGAVIFWALGYGLMFGTNNSGFIGTSGFLPNGATGGINAHLIFQMVFASTASTIMSGSVAERTSYWSYILCTIILTGIIYPISGSWIWSSGGWLAKMDFHDFAGSTVVHSVGAWSALAAIIIIGPRLGRFDKNNKPRKIPGHNLSMVAMGGFILWFGWFGFNGGSTLAITDDIGTILINTHLAGSAGVIGALLYNKICKKPILLVGAINGGLGGLVAITAGCDAVSPLSAMAIGLIGGTIAVAGGTILEKMKLDDVVEAIPVHGFAGAWGTIAVGIFSDNEKITVTTQIIGVLAVFAWTFIVCFIVYWLLNKVLGLRTDSVSEQRGLDYSEHYEEGYPEFSQGLHQEIKR
jgi:ammonium transporter, Amt family